MQSMRLACGRRGRALLEEAGAVKLTMYTTMRGLALTLVATLAIAAAALADSDPNIGRGFDPTKGFQVGDVDAINTFNGNLVVTIPIGGSYPVATGFSYSLALVFNSNAWNFVDSCDTPDHCTSVAEPNPRNNAGFGWTLSLGHLESPGSNAINNLNRWVYVEPDGSEHPFYDRLHAGDTTQPGMQFSRDGSYLRMKDLGGGQHEVDSPDGLVRTFGEDGELSRIDDPFGNYVRLDPMSPLLWRISDSQGRTQTVTFEQGTNGRRIKSIQLAAFGDNGSATWDFNYSPAPVQVPRPCPSANTSPVPVDQLTSIHLPGAGSPDCVTGTRTCWRPTYVPVDPFHHDETCKQPGSLASLTLPTRGKVAWTYKRYLFPQLTGRGGSRQDSNGVATRTLYDSAGVPMGTWSYDTVLDAEIGSYPRELLNTIHTPVGTKTEYFFSVAREDQPGSWTIYDYGLPFSRNYPDPINGTRFLSKREYDANGSVVRSTYVRYEHDPDPGDENGDLEQVKKLNQRLASTHVVYDRDGSRWIDSDSSHFDDHGHYGEVTTTSNFDFGATRTARTGWSPFITPSRWLLNTFTFQEQQQGSAIARQEFTFDPAGTGFLQCKRTLRAGANRDPLDVLVTYHQCGSAPAPACDIAQGLPPGEVVEERWFGGDFQRLATSQGCAAGQGSPAYVYDHEYTAGVRSKTTVGGLTTLDLTINRNSGLPESARDPAGHLTSFTYDALGRLLTSARDGDAATTFLYHDNDDFPFVERIVGTSNPPLEHQRWYYDGFGRVIQAQTSLPTPSAGPERWGITVTLYNAMGWKLYVSEPAVVFEWPSAKPHQPAECLFGKGTSYCHYDAFGRPGTITTADGEVSSLEYRGIRIVKRTSGVWDAQQQTEIYRTTKEQYDALGHLREVTEPNGTRTRYLYDVGGRLSTVLHNVGGSIKENRTFKYDGRGFLTKERHPEINQAVTYLYDPLGNVRSKRTPAGALFFEMDAAGRLLKVSSASTLLRELTYANGRLSQASAFNDRMTGVCTRYEVRQNYHYNLPNGRLHFEDTTLLQGPTELQGWEQTYGYDLAGRVDEITYPSCTSPANCTNPSRIVSTEYSMGRPGHVESQWIPSLKADFIYNGNGTVNTITHGNGVELTQVPNATGMARPGMLMAVDTLHQDADGQDIVLWPPDDYAYDGTGNIRQISDRSYGYDATSRLVSAFVPAPGVSLPFRGYHYDVFGNLTDVDSGSDADHVTSTVHYWTTQNPPTNRLAGAAYDGSGNLTNYQGSYTWDALGQLTSAATGTESWVDMYDAAGERVWSSRTAPSGQSKDVYELRGSGGELLSTFTKAGTAPMSFEDYLYHEGQLLGAQFDDGRTLNFDLDHLGNVRLETGPGGYADAKYREFWPFGEIASTAIPGDVEAMKFAGHQRDFVGTAATADDLDYMHARFYSPLLGRFLSADRHFGLWTPRIPQGWNRYTYALDAPLVITDPTGLDPQCVTVPATKDEPARTVCSDSIDVSASAPRLPTVGGTFDSADDLFGWLTGQLPRVSAASPRSAADLSKTPVMDQIRGQYQQSGCKDGRYYGDFQYAELATTMNPTGQMVGAFSADIHSVGGGQVLVKASNTWGLESATRFPGEGNRGNPSVMDMAMGAPLAYPRSLLNNHPNGPTATATLNYIWMEGSPCGQ